VPTNLRSNYFFSNTASMCAYKHGLLQRGINRCIVLDEDFYQSDKISLDPNHIVLSTIFSYIR
jgi:hypothetical protein